MNTDQFFKQNKMLSITILVILLLVVGYIAYGIITERQNRAARQECIEQAEKSINYFGRDDKNSAIDACKAKYPIEQ